MGLIPAKDVRSLLVGLVPVQCDRLRQKSWTPCSVPVWQHAKLADVSLGTHPRDSLVADEDVNKPTKQTPIWFLDLLGPVWGRSYVQSFLLLVLQNWLCGIKYGHEHQQRFAGLVVQGKIEIGEI